MRHLTKLRICAVFVLLSLLGFTALARQAPFEDPAPIEVANGLSIEGVRKSIKVALVSRDWVISEDTGNKITANYGKKDWSVTITIAYGLRQVAIKYADSSNLDYEQNDDGSREIHPNYSKWIANLVMDINKNMLLMSPTG